MSKDELCDLICTDCPDADIDPGDYYEPFSWDCPGGKDPENPGCPRQAEALELQAEEDMEMEIGLELEATA